MRGWILKGLLAAAVFASIAGAQGDVDSLGPTPPTCEAAGLDYTNPTCTVNTRYGRLHVSHEVRAGGVLTAEVSPGSVPTCGADMPDRGLKPYPCPVTWPDVDGSDGRPYKRGRCTTKVPATCEWYVPSTAESRPYTMLQVTVEGGISRDHYAIIAKDRFLLKGRVTRPKPAETQSAGSGSSPGKYVAAPAPQWLTGGTHPQRDPLHVSLEQRISQFAQPGGGYQDATEYVDANAGEPEAREGGCLTALTIYKRLADEDVLLNRAFDSMGTAFDALNANELAEVGLLATRTIQLVNNLMGVAGNVQTMMNLAENAKVGANLALKAKTVVDAAGTFIKFLTDLQSGWYKGKQDFVGHGLNAATMFANAAKEFASYGAQLGGAVAKTFLAKLGAIKNVIDIINDYNAYRQTLDAATNAYYEAGSQYSRLLDRLKQSVTDLNDAMRDCPPHDGVANVQIVIKGTGVRETRKTDSEGYYNAVLPRGRYTVTASRAGVHPARSGDCGGGGTTCRVDLSRNRTRANFQQSGH